MANCSVVNDGVINVFSIVAFFCVGFGLLRFVNRFETQWVSRDGLKFTAKVSLDSATSEKWIDVKVLVDGGWLIISGRGRRVKQIHGKWRLAYSADSNDARRRQFVISRRDDPKVSATLRVPAASRCVAILEALASS
jgi:hypothetical protein